MYQPAPPGLCSSERAQPRRGATQAALFERGNSHEPAHHRRRRLLTIGALACAAALIPASALAAPGAARASYTATPACATSGLDVWLNTQGNGAAGTIYYELEFTNLSGATCTLFGYPGVSGTDLSGNQLGSAAFRLSGTPQTVTLANGATASAPLGIVEGGIFPSAQCGPVTAAGLRVYPPARPSPGGCRSPSPPVPRAAQRTSRSCPSSNR